MVKVDILMKPHHLDVVFGAIVKIGEINVSELPVAGDVVEITMWRTENESDGVQSYAFDVSHRKFSEGCVKIVVKSRRVMGYVNYEEKYGCNISG